MLSVLILAPLKALAKRLAKRPLVYLTWMRDPTTTMMVNWLDADSHSPDYVLYRRYRSPRQSLGAGSGQSPHVCRPEKAVRTPCGIAGAAAEHGIRLHHPLAGANPRWAVLPVPDDAKDATQHLRFVTGGDMMGDRKRVDAMNKRAAELNPWFALLGGDLAYANGNSNEVGKWDDWLESWMLNCIRRGTGG